MSWKKNGKFPYLGDNYFLDFDLLDRDTDENPKEIIDSQDIREECDKIFIRTLLIEVLSELTERECKVICERFGFFDGTPKTLEQVGNKYRVSRERIIHIEAKALRKLRHPIRRAKLENLGYFDRTIEKEKILATEMEKEKIERKKKEKKEQEIQIKNSEKIAELDRKQALKSLESKKEVKFFTKEKEKKEQEIQIKNSEKIAELDRKQALKSLESKKEVKFFTKEREKSRLEALAYVEAMKANNYFPLD